MQPVQLWGVFYDGVDGRAPSVLKAVYVKEHVAKSRCGDRRSVRPVWGFVETVSEDGHHVVWLVDGPRPFPMGIDLDEIYAPLRASALAKIAPEEKRALGVDS